MAVTDVACVVVEVAPAVLAHLPRETNLVSYNRTSCVCSIRYRLKQILDQAGHFANTCRWADRSCYRVEPDRFPSQKTKLDGVSGGGWRRMFDLRGRWYDDLLLLVPSAAALNARIVSSGLSIRGRVGLHLSGSAEKS